MTAPRSVGLIRGLTFKVMLAVMALSCFVIALPQAYARFELGTGGIPATIQRVSATAAAPTSWSEDLGIRRADFPVRITSRQGTIATNLYLPEPAIRSLLEGRTVAITMVSHNPRRFLLAGEPLPPLGGGWIALGLAFGATFLVALRLR